MDGTTAETRGARTESDGLVEALRSSEEARRRAEDQLGLQRLRLRRLSSELVLAEERERRRLAAELHDGIGQSLALLRRKLAALKGDAVFSGLDVDIAESLALLDRVLRSTRSLTFRISPPVLHDLGLPAALGWLAEDFDARFGPAVTFRSQGPAPALDDALRILLFHAARELLVNAVKHAEAARIDLFFAAQPGELRIRVADDGRGFDPRAVEPGVDGGFGLVAVRERVEHLDGRLEIETAHGQGCRATLILPLEARP